MYYLSLVVKKNAKVLNVKTAIGPKCYLPLLGNIIFSNAAVPYVSVLKYFNIIISDQACYM